MLYKLILTLFIFSFTPSIPFSLRNLYIEVVPRALTFRLVGLLRFRFRLTLINLLLSTLLIKGLLISTLLSVARTQVRNLVGRQLYTTFAFALALSLIGQLELSAQQDLLLLQAIQLLLPAQPLIGYTSRLQPLEHYIYLLGA